MAYMQDAPELWLWSEVAHMAVCRLLTFDRHADLTEATRSLGLALYEETLKQHPNALRAVRHLGGEAAEMRAMEFLAAHGFPEVSPPTPRNHPRKPGQKNRRQTPEYIRRLWPISATAVERTFLGLHPETQKGLTLELSWALHVVGFSTFPWYRDEITERRLLPKAFPQRSA